MKPIYILLVFQALSTPVGYADESVEPQEAKDVSLIQVLANPKEYAGEIITVGGFLNMRGTHLFLTKEHRALDDYASAIYVCTDCYHDDASKRAHIRTGCENRYVRLTGLFVKGGHPIHYMIPSPYWMANIYRIDGARNVEQPYWFNPNRECWTNPNASASAENIEQ